MHLLQPLKVHSQVQPTGYLDHKWMDWLHHPCLPSGGEGSKWLHNPCLLGVPCSGET